MMIEMTAIIGIAKRSISENDSKIAKSAHLPVGMEALSCATGSMSPKSTINFESVIFPAAKID
jgi:hypothetical protein